MLTARGHQTPAAHPDQPHHQHQLQRLPRGRRRDRLRLRRRRPLVLPLEPRRRSSSTPRSTCRPATRDCAGRRRSTTCASATSTTTSCAPRASRTSCARRSRSTASSKFISDPHELTGKIGKHMRTDASLQSKEELLRLALARRLLGEPSDPRGALPDRLRQQLGGLVRRRPRPRRSRRCATSSSRRRRGAEGAAGRRQRRRGKGKKRRGPRGPEPRRARRTPSRGRGLRDPARRDETSRLLPEAARVAGATTRRRSATRAAS